MCIEASRCAVRTGFVLLFLAALATTVPGAWAQSYVFGRLDAATPNPSVAVLTADFNGDGRPDLAVLNGLSSCTPDCLNGTLSVFLGQPGGTFAAAVNTSVGVNPVQFVAGDFNGDGRPDLAVIYYGTEIDVFSSATVSVLLGNGDGTFQSPVNYATGNGTSAIVAADFNGDGKLDLATANQSDNTVSILLGNGDGTFQPHFDYPSGTTAALTAGDFNGDGKPDLATTAASTPANVSVLINNGDGSFKAPVSYSGGGNAITNADLTGNGKFDLITNNGVLLGNGDGTFQAPLPGPGVNGTIVVADFNGDGKPDLATPSAIFLGNGDGTFQPPIYYTGPGSSLTVGDFNADGKLDLAGASGLGAAVLIGHGDGTFGANVTDFPIASSETGGGGVVTADFNNDGKLDFAATSGLDVSILLGNGDGTFQAYMDFNTGNQTGGLAAADFNSDGKQDLAVLHPQGNTVEIFLGNGDGTFQTGSTYATGQSPAFVATGDFNGDGKTDLAIANLLGNTVSILLGNGDGTFRPQVTYASGDTPQSIAVGDFKGDGKLDLAVADAFPSIIEGSTVSVLLGNGDGTFQAPVAYPALGQAWSVVTGDFNSDGRLDLAVGNVGFPALLLGNGDGTFQAATIITSSIQAYALMAADVNGDGKLDVVTSGADWVLLGNGDGTFQSPVGLPLGYAGSPVVSGDFNGDGALDLASQSLVGVDVALDTPVIGFSAAGITFTGQGVGTTSSPQTLTISNPGSMPFSISSITVSGAGFAETNTCGTSLNIGQSCTVSITFSPPTAGSATGTLTFTDSVPGSPQVIALNGTPGPVVTLSPTTVTFSSQLIGTVSPVQVVTLTNTGNAILTFTGGSMLAGLNAGDFLYCASMDVPTATCRYEGIMDCGVTMSLDPGGSCTVGLAFDPTAAGTRVATLSFTDNASGSPQVVTLTGTGTGPAPVVTLVPAALSFSSRQVGTASPAQTVTLTNTGSVALTITSITASGDFFVSSACGSAVAAGAHCTLTVIFKPTAAGTRTGVLTLTDDAPGSPQTLALTGTGTAPGASLAPASLSFGTELAGQSGAPSAVTLTNSGGAALTISSISVAGTNSGDFSQQNNCGTSVAAGATCTINVTFKPTAGGSRAATLMVSDNAPGSPQTLALSGIGEDFSLAPTGPSSATVAAGGTATYKITGISQGSFTSNVGLTCSGAPSASTCTVMPAAIPVGSGATATVTVTTTARSGAMSRRPKPPTGGSRPEAWPVCGLLGLLVLAAGAKLRKLAGVSGRQRMRWAVSPVRIWILAALLAGIVVLAPSCGGGTTTTTITPSGTPAGTYTVTITGTYGFSSLSGSFSLTQSTALTLTVQ